MQTGTPPVLVKLKRTSNRRSSCVDLHGKTIAISTTRFDQLLRGEGTDAEFWFLIGRLQGCLESVALQTQVHHLKISCDGEQIWHLHLDRQP